ncbi:Pentatricopeptide repeat-containing protein [Thalictrum thalictroides]|uniref:Pentatricopeptide repeat-containing protein n=1 Tax=Thalictrum thalictroides TaxID=46969 RepID=A0A7J6WVA8_THATH|nr:Pentatricopeptide repeat-containing protein [Thalictrum thalictroides]
MLINGLQNEPHLLNQFVSTIALNHSDHPNKLDYSNQVFEYVQNPTGFTLNSLIRAHSKSSSPHLSFYYYNQILQSSNLFIYLDNYTFTFLVRACTQILSRECGFAVHAAVIKHGFEFSRYVQCALVQMYAELGLFSLSRRLFLGIVDPDLVLQTTMVSASAKLGKVIFARKLFDEMPTRDLAAWSAIIAGYAQCGKSKEALDLFHLMQREGVMVNEVVMTSVLSACSHLCALDQGRWAHGYIERNKIRMTVTLGSALIDMYAKCGDMGKAMEAFWGMRERNVYTWSCAMSGLAMNGSGKECLELFALMKEQDVQPNEVTFVAVLRGCSVVGLVDEGHRHFESMKQVYGLEPRLEHYGCMVDLYCRAGRLDDAIEFINNMPVEPHAGAWGALLSACKIHGNVELGELAFRKLVELEENNDVCRFHGLGWGK